MATDYGHNIAAGRDDDGGHQDVESIFSSPPAPYSAAPQNSPLRGITSTRPFSFESLGSGPP